MNGILPLWKPKGLTSHDCVMKVRHLFHVKKVGHTGTLDPEVEGVLPICIGEATKVVQYLTPLKKTYIATIQLGIATDTEDAHGKVIEKKEIMQTPSVQTIDDVLQSFKGNITQIPPMYSAVKVKGKKLYEYARANEQIERPKRNVSIYDIYRMSPLTNNDTSFQIKVVCSQGTYIRTLCVDIGKELGYPAHMSHLVRIGASSFTAKDTVKLPDIEQYKKKGKLKELLIPMADGLKHMDRLYVNQETKQRISHGQKLRKPTKQLHSDPFLVMYREQLLAIYQIHPENSNVIKPVRVFNG